jgi:flagellar hook-associated protein 3 FlgL
MLTRIATSTLNSTMLDAALRLQARQAETQVQLSTGLRSATYAGLGAGTAERTLSLESAMSRSQSLIDGMETAGARAEVMYAAMGDVIDLLTTLRSSLSAGTTGTEADEIPTAAEGMLQDMERILNQRYEGRYLFGGCDTTEAPVDVSALTPPTVPSTADTGYYQGGDGTPSVRLGEDQRIAYGTNAGDPAIEQALRAVHLAATLTTTPLDEAALTEAYDLATTALDDLIALQSGLSTAASRIATAQAEQEATQALMADTFGDLTGVDVAEATVRLSQYETQLDASYSALSTIMGSCLLDYIR